jgi:two-component system, chemotaxis family, protein-glutamate methylesterase/glutaminase
VNTPIRVMIVDDSSVVRKLLTSALANHPEVTVVGSAANGLIALNKLPQLLPDAVILDVEMPEMDGITACARIRESYPRLPVIMFSTLTDRGASVTFDALAAGASDYVLKPSAQQGDSLEQVVSKSLVPKLIALTRARPAIQAALAMLNEGKAPAFDAPSSTHRVLPEVSRARPSLPTRPSLPARPSLPQSVRAPEKPKLEPRPDSLRSAKLPALRKPVQLIAIACSTGGPNALAELVPRLPAALPVPVLIVQHMPPIFTRTLAERLALRSALKVIESSGGELLRAGEVYVAPGNRHLEVHQDERGTFTLLTDGPAENSCRPSADVTFRSLVRVFGGGVLAVVLTGMGHDGARGAKEIAEAGGRVIAQSGPTCVVWGMPRAVEEAGITTAVVPLSEMAGAILQQIGSGLLFPRHVEPER